MDAIQRAILAVLVGVALCVVIAESALALLQFMAGADPLLRELAAAGPAAREVLLVSGLIWLLAGAAGGAMAAALSRCAWLAVPVGFLGGLAPAFTALVGAQPFGWVLALVLLPLLGALVAARAVDHLLRLDGTG